MAGKRKSGGTGRDGDLAASVQAVTEEVVIDEKLPTREKSKMEAEKRGFQVLAYGRDAKYRVDVWKNQFYVLTNDGAPKYRVSAASYVAWSPTTTSQSSASSKP